MDLGLRDHVYIVTGGTRGLGRATAGILVDEGARVVLCSRDAEEVSAAERELNDRGPGGTAADRAVVGIAGDLGEEDTGTRLVAAAHSAWDRLDGALISVGGPPPGSATGVEDAVWREAFESTFLGPLRIARAVAAQVGPQGGSIAFVLSSSVRSPVEGLATSNGLRPGLAMLAKTLADELGPRGVRVNGLLPGRIDTDRTRELDTRSGRPVTARRDQEGRIPLRRYGEPIEFGRAAAFLLSPAASYLTGVMLPIDGGAGRML